ncbi:MAG: HAD-IA family hydrolase [Deltaproteobacteria bacterium]|nr:HAD-IA family hydrolase [Deltaproteobacteria bacterium]
MSVDAILFDLDGTLVDSRQDLALSVQVAFEELELPVPDFDAVIASVGHGARHLVKVLMPENDWDEASLDRVIGAFRAHYLEHLLDHTRPFEGLREVVEELSAAVPLAVLTNKPGEMARRIIEGLGWDGAFRFVMGPDDAGSLKPDPVGLLNLLGRMGVEPGRAIYVGDMPIDVEVAKAAGCQSVAVTWGLAEEGAIEVSGPDRLLHQPSELLQLIPG